MKKIGLICAFYDEIIYFVEKYKIDIKKDINEFVIGNYKVILACTGVGKVNAAMIVQKIIDLYHPKYILNSGCSGALKEMPLYKIVLSEHVMYHDFTPKEIMQKYVPEKGMLEASSLLLEQAKQICNESGVEAEVGLLVSGDCYVESEEKKKTLLEDSALCVDMESAAIGHVCKKNEIPFLCIRSISDFANGSEIDETESSKRAAMVTEKIIMNLS